VLGCAPERRFTTASYRSSRRRTTSAGLADHTRAITLNAQDLNETSSAIDLFGSKGGFPIDPDLSLGVSVHWAAGIVSDYFAKAFGRVGILGDETPITHYVNTGYGGPARYIHKEKCVEYGSSAWVKPPGALDLVAHELTHGVTHSTVGFYPFDGLGEEGESGALNEAFADIFACLIEFTAPGVTGNWQFLENLNKWQIPARDLSDPKAQFNPDTYGKDHWVDPVQFPGDGSTHINCTVMGFCFYLLSEGGIGTNDNFDFYDVTGIGKEEAGQIAYLALTKLGHSAVFQDARKATVEAAVQLYGEFSQERISTENAWYAVGVGPKYAETPYYVPQNMATKVEPWTATLQWQAGQEETDWEVQVGTDPSFTVVLMTIIAGAIDTANGVKVGVTEETLKPNTDYYWRVRKYTEDPAVKGWRPANQFTTAEKTTTLIAPKSLELKETFHPWALAFSWKEVDGAAAYTVQVASKPFPPSNSPSKPSLIFPEVSSTKPNIELDVKVKSSLWWRVRPNAPGNDPKNDGDWSVPLQFKTKMPQVTIISPSAGDPKYPWNLELKWSPVKGFGYYKVEMTRTESQFGLDSLEKNLDHIAASDLSDPSNPAVIINLVPRNLEFNETHFWRVRVIGPKPLEEEGEHDESWFVNDGDDTEVKPIDDDDLGLTPKDLDWWLPSNAGGQKEILWKGVPGAVAYAIKVRSFNDNGDESGTLFSKTVPHNSAAEISSSPQSIELHASDLHPTVGRTGYLPNVYAIGPEDIEGLAAKENFDFKYVIFVLPDKPNLSSPSEGATDVPYENTRGTSQSEYTPSGKYLIELYEGEWPLDNMPIDLQLQLGISKLAKYSDVLPRSPDGNIYGPFWLLEPETTYTWRVRALSTWDKLTKDPDWKWPQRYYPWSDAETFTTEAKPKPKPQPLDPPQVFEGIYSDDNILLSDGLLWVIFWYVASATKFQMEVYQADTLDLTASYELITADEPIGKPQLFEWTSEDLFNATLAWVNSLAPSPLKDFVTAVSVAKIASFVLVGSQPHHSYRYRVRGLKEGAPGPWSAWSIYSEGWLLPQ
jgi:hypothetical protein